MKIWIYNYKTRIWKCDRCLGIFLKSKWNMFRPHLPGYLLHVSTPPTNPKAFQGPWTWTKCRSTAHVRSICLHIRPWYMTMATNTNWLPRSNGRLMISWLWCLSIWHIVCVTNSNWLILLWFGGYLTYLSISGLINGMGVFFSVA